jgi:hypothetical protein
MIHRNSKRESSVETFKAKQVDEVVRRSIAALRQLEAERRLGFPDLSKIENGESDSGPS